MLIEYPGLTELKCVYGEKLEDVFYNDDNSEERSVMECRSGRDILLQNSKESFETLKEDFDVEKGAGVVKENGNTDNNSRCEEDTERCKNSDAMNIKGIEGKENNPDESDSVETVKIKKKVSFHVSSEKSTAKNDNNKKKTVATIDHQKHEQCLKIISPRQC